MNMPFASKDDKLVEVSGLTLAIGANISQPTLSRYLAGTSDTMEMPTWQALAHTLGVTVSQLLGEIPLAPDSHASAVQPGVSSLG